MLFSQSEEHVARWCKARGLAVRPFLSLERLWHLAVIWYGNRLTVESRRSGPEEMASIFAAIGLERSFWDPQAEVF